MLDQKPADGTIGKALQVLDLVADFKRPVRFAELQEKSDFPKATLYRLVQSLTNQGMLTHDPDRMTYAPGVRLLRLAHAAWQQSSLARIAGRHLDKLAADVDETVHLAQLDNAQVLYIDKRVPKQPVEMYSQAGKVGPAYCTGVGKVMLAYQREAVLPQMIAQQSFHRFTDFTLTDETALRKELKAIRDRGYGFDREEHEPGIICIALPILSRGGRLYGALSVTSTTQRTDLTKLEKLVPQIRETAMKISDEAEAWRFPDPHGGE
ncbi:IclR family transcriptional regulator [Actibacterium lipolyticum]|uniref:Transcriptional regulator KdgR n=1 Tax=Actibacterium lipolyticum TaxID=1524263 RepID=A0A238KJC7_9RHOB|nr:IclR family transcriptional regulator [Actibacterium lipolyticum]SMX42925.1 Transcriptional regulator KdgR [Actibacterium lipolyticum]